MKILILLLSLSLIGCNSSSGDSSNSTDSNPPTNSTPDGIPNNTQENTIIVDTIDYFNTDFSSTFNITKDFWDYIYEDELDCIQNDPTLGDFFLIRELYRDGKDQLNDFFTNGSYYNERLCLDQLVSSFVYLSTNNNFGLDRDQDVLDLLNNYNNLNFSSKDGALNEHEQVILELLFEEL